MLGAVPDRPTRQPSQRPPSVDALARSIADVGLPQPLLVDAARAAIAAGDPDSARARAEATAHALLQPVVNATGVLLHTNLGRAPRRVGSRTPGYSNLELDLDHRTARLAPRARGGAARPRRAAPRPRSSSTTAPPPCCSCSPRWPRGRGVVVSRGELVEIGGGFRVPEVHGAVRRPPRRGRHHQPHPPAPTTERARSQRRRRRARAEGAPVELPDRRVHRGDVEVAELADARTCRSSSTSARACSTRRARGCRRPAGVAARRAGGPPDARRRRRAGDVLGRQAARRPAGRASSPGAPTSSTRCARHPLARALRPGGLVLAALQDDRRSPTSAATATPIPFWRMATIARRRARAAGRGARRRRKVVDTRGRRRRRARCPASTIPSVGVAVDGDRTDRAARATTPPVIARVDDGAHDLRPAHRRPGRRRRARVALSAR